MRAFLHRWRWWLWGGAACLLVLSFAGVVFLLQEEPDGSEEVLERVQLGMSAQKVVMILKGKEFRWGIWFSGFFCRFRDYDVFREFDGEDKVIAKSRVLNRGAWHDFLAYWYRIWTRVGV
jgi:hypothetical protein